MKKLFKFVWILAKVYFIFNTIFIYIAVAGNAMKIALEDDVPVIDAYDKLFDDAFDGFDMALK